MCFINHISCRNAKFIVLLYNEKCSALLIPICNLGVSLWDSCQALYSGPAQEQKGASATGSLFKWSLRHREVKWLPPGGFWFIFPCEVWLQPSLGPMYKVLHILFYHTEPHWFCSQTCFFWTRFLIAIKIIRTAAILK